jgi:hypothetical protein
MDGFFTFIVPEKASVVVIARGKGPLSSSRRCFFRGQLVVLGPEKEVNKGTTVVSRISEDKRAGCAGCERAAEPQADSRKQK